MTNMELLVRPFAAERVAPAGINLSPNFPPDIVVCSLGGSGVQTVSWTFNGHAPAPTSTDPGWMETSRSSDKVRITNSDDASQFVDVCRVRGVKMAASNKSSAAPRQSSFTANGGEAGQSNLSPQDSSYTFKPPADAAECVTPTKPARGCAG